MSKINIVGKSIMVTITILRIYMKIVYCLMSKTILKISKNILFVGIPLFSIQINQTSMPIVQI